MPDRILRQLRLAARLPDAAPLLADIISEISPDAALDFAEVIDDDPIVQMVLLRLSRDRSPEPCQPDARA